jgi:hypothetical protein
MSRQERDATGRIVSDGSITTQEMPNTTTTTTTTTPTGEIRSRESMNEPVTWEEMRALLRREPTMYERTWRPTVGGLLAILAGSWNFLLGLGAVIGGAYFPTSLPTVSGFSGTLSTTAITAGAALIVLGLIAIIGGAYALARRGWPMALAGSIAAIIPTPLFLPFIMGFFSLIFNVLGHKEFWGPHQVQKDIQSNIQHTIDKS